MNQSDACFADVNGSRGFVPTARWGAALLASACLILMGSLPAQAQVPVTYADGTFADANWSMFTETVGPGSATASQVSSGGNPGFWRRVEITTNDAYVYTFSYSATARFSPSTSGAVASIDLSFDHYAYEIVGAFDQGGRTTSLRVHPMLFPGNQIAIHHITVGVDLLTTIVRRNYLKHLASGRGIPISQGKREHLTGLTRDREPQPTGILLALDKRPHLLTLDGIL